MKALLISTDGYSIQTKKCDSIQEAQKIMSDEYKDAYPEVNDESSEEMSSISERDAILYANGENVFVWSIVEI
ncbi:hypothetical protein DW886_16600 [Enterocloster aldenensis]|uniref:hypothetical protein n=1 Tax=Enterocloster aldenensis TaxID=358742 RepID=UPI000E5411AF|nr:hypothetical protein DW886_16600 [Enterocloster aldenensis]